MASTIKASAPVMSYLSKPPIEAATAFIGRGLIAYVFVGAAFWHLRPAGWELTINEMRGHGIFMPQLLLLGAMAVSSLASLALLLDWRSRWAAFVLAGYTLLVSSVMHNPLHAVGPVLFMYIKDLGIAGALMAFAANTPNPIRSRT